MIRPPVPEVVCPDGQPCTGMARGLCPRSLNQEAPCIRVSLTKQGLKIENGAIVPIDTPEIA